MIRHSNGYLEEYYSKSKSGEIIIGRELMTELERLMTDLDNPRYIYDTKDADVRIDFIEHVVKLTKSPFYGKPMKLMLFQKAFLSALFGFKMADTGFDRFKKALFLIGRKNGKALALDTRIPTPNGDKTMGEISVGDYVFNELGKPVKVIGESKIFTDHDCYEVVFEDGERIIADADHRWAVQTKNTQRNRKYNPQSNRARTAFNDIDEFGYKVVTTADMVGDYARRRHDGKGTEYKYHVPKVSAVVYPEKPVKIHPYVLGLWLGDGSTDDNRISCSLDDAAETIKNIEKCGYKTSVKRYGNAALEIRLHGQNDKKLHNEIRDGLRFYGVWENKHIPEDYLTASVEQRTDLLRGLMDTDGTVSKSGQCEFTQKSKTVTDDMSRLLSSLGIKHTVKEKTATCNGKDCGTVYRIMFYVDRANSCFRLARKTARLKERLNDRMNLKSIVSIKKVDSVPCKCISVDSKRGLYLCGEKNTVTHNTELVAALVVCELVLGNPGSDIVCSGGSDKLASLVYDAVDTMRILIDPQSLDLWKNQMWIRNLTTNTKVFKLSETSRGKEGRNIDFASLDETHELLYDCAIVKAVEQSQSIKDNPKYIELTTEGFVSEGHLSKQLEKARDIINGDDDSISAERFLPWLYTMDSEAEIWQNEASWVKANPTVGVVKKMDYLREQVDLARKSKADRVFVLTKDFNIHQNHAESWLMEEDLAYSATYDLADFRGSVCLGGVDLAKTTDLVNAKALMMKPGDKTKYILSHYWIPESKLRKSPDTEAGAKYEEWAREGIVTICDGNEVDLTLVADWYKNLYTEHGIALLACGYDRAYADIWLERMSDYGFDTIMVRQNRFVMSEPIRLAEADFKDGLINYNDNPCDLFCFRNAGVEIDNQSNIMLVKPHGRAAWRIDGAVTLAIVYEAFRRKRTEFLEIVGG